MVSTHAPLAGSDCLSGLLSGARIVSTHAPLAGSDRRCRRRCPPRRVSTHAPLAGSDSAFAVPNWHTRQFPPTLPLRGATFVQVGYRCRCFCFNPRSPCGERRQRQTCSLMTGGFNPRSPCGERPDDPTVVSRGVAVSTHAPLAGRDAPCRSVGGGGTCFNPRSPCGERPPSRGYRPSRREFQPTLPLRGATRAEKNDIDQRWFQPTLPLRGAISRATI